MSPEDSANVGPGDDRGARRHHRGIPAAKAGNGAERATASGRPRGAGVVGLLGGIVGFVVHDEGGSDVASCIDVFVDGATTQQSWDDDGVACVDDEGDRTFMLTWAAFCWEEDDTPLTNDYGWGYVDQPWNAGEDAPHC